tara:strand:- start:54 stop:446 length:393 start_codon:yes stop_codon:yes gene_type:complete
MDWQNILKANKNSIVEPEVMKRIVDTLGLPKEDKDGIFDYEENVSDFKLDASADGKDNYISITVKPSGVIKIIDADSNNVVHKFTSDKIKIAQDTSIPVDISEGEAKFDLYYDIVDIDNDGILVIKLMEA